MSVQEVLIDKVGFQGDGLSRDGVVVPLTLPGERVTVRPGKERVELDGDDGAWRRWATVDVVTRAITAGVSVVEGVGHRGPGWSLGAVVTVAAYPVVVRGRAVTARPRS